MTPILNVDDAALTHYAHGERFDARDGSVGEPIGARQLGCSVTVVPPGKRAWPFHRHHVNEELVYVIEGRGTLRLGDEEHPVREGDVIAFPAGGPAHQLVNTSQEDLRYLSVSTMIAADIIEYPDSGKIALRAGSAPGGDPAQRTCNLVARRPPAVDYWEGER